MTENNKPEVKKLVLQITNEAQHTGDDDVILWYPSHPNLPQRGVASTKTLGEMHPHKH